MQNIINMSKINFLLFLVSSAVVGCVAVKSNLVSIRSDTDNGGLYLPGGFGAIVVADSVGPTRHIAVNANGDIYAKFSRSRKGMGGTVALRDLNGDGKVDSMVRFGNYEDVGSSAVGVTIYNGYLYTSTVNQVLRNKLKAGELVPTSPTEIVLTDTDPNVARNWHTTKPLAFDKKGNMYVPFGSPSDAGQDLAKFGPIGIPNGKGLDPSPELGSYGGIWRFDAGKVNLTQKDGRKYATGIRSVVGMMWNPQDDNLYAVMNGIDNFHTIYPDLFTAWQAAVLPSEPLLKVTPDANFGWPYAYYDHIQGKNLLQPGYGGDGKTIGRAAKFDVPVAGFPGHWAPMDILFYQGNQFPPRYKQGAFIAFHGSTDRSPYPQAGYIVCFVPLAKGKQSGDWEVFADGFTKVDTVVNTSDAVYRPMGLAEGPDGSLYISESNKGKIWRILYNGDKNSFGNDQLAKMELRKTSRSYIKQPDVIKDNLQRPDRLAGGILYNTYCASCHQRDGKGDNSRFPPLAGSDWVTGDKTRLINTILNGLDGEIKVNGQTWNGLMPAHGGFLDDHAVASIATYIRQSFGNRASSITTGEVSKQRK
ncbi:c-type cytochrome [Daejeonella lutea]|uniref:Glucose/arabinose dehydrogenase, beta-propeller fold n=1 Tax=Daejeonella lutea TaxID=572036 RepID=A0A1T5BZX2_9SPHI|nr:c-type cytochrome [Daejeonella lutea]SKB52714.1 Glucose/arabinose dehydrogenase, beta-propeller fold [Daejeonella lutea]